MEATELKTLIEKGNETIAALRSEVDGMKSADVVSQDKIARIEADLTKTLSEKSALENRLAAVETLANRPGLAAKGNDAVDEHKTAFINFLRNSTDHEAKSTLMEISKKSINVTTGANGAFAVPTVIAAEIASVAKDFGAMRQLARVVQVGTPDHKEIVSLGGANYEWVGDTDTRNVTTAPTIARIAPTFGEITARVEITTQSLEDIFYDVEAWVQKELGESFAQGEGVAFISGDGSDKPTGLLNGTTVTDIASGQAATFGTSPYDNIVDLVYSIKGAYRSNASFLMNSATLSTLVKVKDENGNYVYHPSLAAGVASTLFGYATVTDENMPNVGAGAKPIVFGNFERGYLIADRIGMTTLVNPYKTSGIVEIEARKRVGGIVKDASALKALRIAAS
ncbi:phage major capsid protein [Paracoccus sp. (in: a-proteobacteria)]|uniref:phage major capsid protein n=1 Tax=Paracoccus sp. TaxID=267 RepID=UPI004059820C